jgi:hypothetical protein
LLADIRTAFEAFNAERMTSAAMIAELVKGEEGPWWSTAGNSWRVDATGVDATR